MKMLDETGLDKTINVGYYYYTEKLGIFLIAFYIWEYLKRCEGLRVFGSNNLLTGKESSAGCMMFCKIY